MSRAFLCVVFLSAGTVSYGSVTYCWTSVNVQVGQLGAIHCSFPESICDKKFIVVRHGPSSTEDEERIVNCYNINGVGECDVLSGYNFTCTNGPLQTVFIPIVTKQHEGTYIFCRLIPSDPNDCKSCYLNVTDPGARKHDSSQKHEGKARYNGDNDDKETPNQTGSNQTSTLSPGAMAGIVVGALIGFAVAVAVAVVVVKKRKQTSCKKRGGAANIPPTIEDGVTSSEKAGDQTPCISPITEGDDTSSDSSQGSTTLLVKDTTQTVYNFTAVKT